MSVPLCNGTDYARAQKVGEAENKAKAMSKSVSGGTKN